MPNVIGKLNAPKRCEALRDAGLTPTVEEEETEVAGKVGRAIDQFPPPGSEARAGRHEVTLVVGKRASGAGRRSRRIAEEEEGAVRVAVLSGGRSSEHDVSLRSGASVVAGAATRPATRRSR